MLHLFRRPKRSRGRTAVRNTSSCVCTKKVCTFFSFSVTSFQGVCDCEFHVDVASLKWCVQILMVLALIKMPTLIIWHYFFFSKKNFFEPQIYKILVYMKKITKNILKNIFSNDVLIVHSVWKSYKMSHFTQIKNATNKLKT